MEKNLNKDRLCQQVEAFFGSLGDKPEKLRVDELITIVEAIIPIHAGLEIENFDDIDTLLAIYPYMYQKLVKLFAYFSHKVRIQVQRNDKKESDAMRSYRDALEQLMKAVKMQYDGLSRRVTVNIDRRG